MPAANPLPQFPGFAAYADPFRTTAFTMWAGYWRACANAAVWWTEKWMEGPIGLMSGSPAAAKPAPKGPAAVIDLAEAAAARVAAEVSDVAALSVEIAETAVEVPVSIAEDAVSVVVAAAETLIAEPDDLTRMVGIGPKLAVALAQRGVTRFVDIAAWTEKDLADVDKALDLKGRAVRDAWVSQAKRFSAGG